MWGRKESGSTSTSKSIRVMKAPTCLEDSDRSVREDLSIAQVELGSTPTPNKPTFYKGYSYRPRVASEGEKVSDVVASSSESVKNAEQAKIPHFEMDSTKHLKRGKGVLASKKDVTLSPEEFAEGTKLLQAACVGDIGRVDAMLSIKPEHVQFRDYDRRTALHVAASEGHFDIVKLLVEKFNSPVNRSDRWGGSPLDDAHRHRHEQVAMYLRSKGGSTGSMDLKTLLISAVANGDMDELKMLLRGYATKKEKKPFLLSISNSGKNLNKSRSLDVNGQDYDGRTALHIAASVGNVEAVKILVENGANVNVLDCWGGRPLDDAIRKKAVQCIYELKNHGAMVGQDSRSHIESSPSREEKSYKRSSSLDYSSDNLRVDFSELEMIEKIGAGAFGEIYSCRWRGIRVAAKCIKSTKIVDYWQMNDDKAESTRSVRREIRYEEMTEEEVKMALEDFRMETSILRSLRHPNICLMLAYSHTDQFEVMVSELMKCSLLDIFKANLIHHTSLSKKKQILYAKQLAQGMNYLHKCSPPVIHRDLKPANLLIDFAGTLKITDFGLAKVRPDPTTTETDQFRMTGETGSYRFMAPEVFRHEEYSEKVDMYSFAMILYYLLLGRPPWEQDSGMIAAQKAAIDGERPVIDRSWDIALVSLLQRCWDENQKVRPSFAVILTELSEYSENALHMEEGMPVDDSKCGRCVIS